MVHSLFTSRHIVQRSSTSGMSSWRKATRHRHARFHCRDCGWPCRSLGCCRLHHQVPTPFTDKLSAKTAEQQAAEEARLKSWDPNGPLASLKRLRRQSTVLSSPHQAPLSASGAQMQQPPAATTRLPAASGQAQPSVETGGGFAIPGDREQELARARAEAETKLKADLRAQELARTKAKAEEVRQQNEANASSDPIGTLLQARNHPSNTTTTPTTQANAGEPFVYYVQVGAFRDHSSADSQGASITNGAKSSCQRTPTVGAHRLPSSPRAFNSKNEADSARARGKQRHGICTGTRATLRRCQHTKE